MAIVALLPLPVPTDDPNLNPIQFEANSPWQVEVEPTRLILPWPGDTAPTLTEVKAALEQALDGTIEVETELDTPDDDVAWSAVLLPPGWSFPVIVWAETAKPVTDALLPDSIRDEFNAANWAVGAETLLDTGDPLGSYTTLVRMIAAAWPDAPGLFDLSSSVCHTRSRLDELFMDPEIDPSSETLWTMHAVHSSDPDAPDTTYWLHTHGLWRCGWAELEMLEVPADRARSAADLLNTLADHVIESGIPDPGKPWQVGPGLVVVAQPWEEVAPFVARDASGGLIDRGGDPDDNPHTGVRAVVCSPKQKGTFRKVWSWPEEVLNALERDEAIVWFTERATRHQAKLARKHFDEFATAFAAARNLPKLDGRPRAIFALKAGFAAPGDDETSEDTGREHLWFEVVTVEGSLRGKLMNDPVHVAMTKGQTYDIGRDRISDWAMITPLGNFEPARAHELWPTIERLRAEAG